jgi:biopolymer transport protein ExbB
MENGYTFNSLEFISAGGPVSILVALLLLVMSVASWVVIISKTYQGLRAKKIFKAYVQQFWQASNLSQSLQASQGAHHAAANIARTAVNAAEHHHTHAAKAIAMHTQANVNLDDFVARQMNRSISDEASKREQGLTILASVGSVAPFVGLFGTVWGIYHALASISQSGQATLDKVAGPVGEALIMTALGLAVAIPAVLAYNALVRANRNYVYELEHFGSQIHTLLVTGALLNTSDAQITKASVQPSKPHMQNAQVPA